MGDNYYALGAVYDPMATGACAQNMDILVQAMEAEEGCAPAHWKAAIQKAIDWVIHLIEKENGALKHSYTAQEQGVFNAIEPMRFMHCGIFIRKRARKNTCAQWRKTRSIFKRPLA